MTMMTAIVMMIDTKIVLIVWEFSMPGVLTTGPKCSKNFSFYRALKEIQFK